MLEFWVGPRARLARTVKGASKEEGCLAVKARVGLSKPRACRCRLLPPRPSKRAGRERRRSPLRKGTCPRSRRCDFWSRAAPPWTASCDRERDPETSEARRKARLRSPAGANRVLRVNGEGVTLRRTRAARLIEGLTTPVRGRVAALAGDCRRTRNGYSPSEESILSASLGRGPAGSRTPAKARHRPRGRAMLRDARRA